MKKLNGKCLGAFGDKCVYDYEEFMELPESCQNALIIDFFQYQQIWERIFYVEYRKTAFMDSKHATNEAIIKANLIFNEL